jgi:hypothetical protein
MTFSFSCLVELYPQVYHGWKESRRAGCTPLKVSSSVLEMNPCACVTLLFVQVQLTYLTLPWWTIIKDILDTRETPLLSF